MEKNKIDYIKNYGYLRELSPECIEMVVRRAEQGGVNLYHSCMAVIGNLRKQYGEYGTPEEYIKCHCGRLNISKAEEPLVKELYVNCVIKTACKEAIKEVRDARLARARAKARGTVQ